MSTIHDIKKKIRNPALIVLILLMCFMFGYETRKNRKYNHKRLEKIESLEKQETYHPLKIFNINRYVEALRLVEEDPGTRYWIVPDLFYPVVLVNYHVFPNELYMSTKTQNIFFRTWLKGADESLRHVPPKYYDKIIVIQDDTIRLTDEW